MKTRAVTACIAILCSLAVLTAQENDPLRLEFHQLGSRQLVLENTLPLCELNAAASPWVSTNGLLALGNAGSETNEISLAVGAINPYATCAVDIREVQGGTAGPAEVVLDFDSLGGAARVQVVASYGSQTNGVVLRLVKQGKVVREQILSKLSAPAPPCLLLARLSGTGVAVSTVQAGRTTLLGATTAQDNFGDVADMRAVRLLTSSTFSISARVPPGGHVVLGGARAFLSAGAGVENVRLITHKDGAPILENNRLWFTFNSLSGDASGPTQGVLSLDPSLMDPRFEGMILFDHGDGVLRNDCLSQLFYDYDVAEWRGWSGGHQFVLARSLHDPRRGLSVMRAAVTEMISGEHQDVCGIFDRVVKKWRVATTSRQGGKLRMFESFEWAGPYRPIAGPVESESTGISMQNVGSRFYIFSGAKAGQVMVYSYPDLRFLGKLKMDFLPQAPGSEIGQRTAVIPLPSGFLYRYLAMTMGRAASGLVFHGALGDDPDAPYEYGGDLSVK